MIAFPQTDEYFSYYGTYIQRVPTGSDIFSLLSQQPDELETLLHAIPDAQANHRPAPHEWSIKEVIGHICDGERVFAYRTVCIARGDTTPLPGFEQDDYVHGTDFNKRTLPSLLEEFRLQRRANVVCFDAFSAEEIDRRGTASTYPFSVRALLYTMAGHVMHHIESLKVDYQVNASAHSDG